MKRLRIAMIAALAGAVMITAGALSGCAKTETPPETEAAAAAAKTESAAAAETESAAAADTDKTAAQAQSTAAQETPDAEAEPAESNEKTYESKDCWKITYAPSMFELKEDKPGEVCFIYKGKCTGRHEVRISYHPGKLPTEVLYEKTADLPEERITRSEGWFGGTYPAWSYSRSISAGDDGISENLTGIEHNGGTLIVHVISGTEEDEDINMSVSDDISGLLDSLQFTKHEPQQEMAYKIGTYVREYKEEMEGKEQTFTDTIVLREDHTGTMSFQDDIDIIWSSWELIEWSGSNRYEYDVEGDNLLVNMNDGGEWAQFQRKQ